MMEFSTLTCFQVVFVKDGDVWKRAAVKGASQQGYTCWLLDYGVSYVCKNVYKCPESYKCYEPLVAQVSLSNVVGLKKNFHTIEFTEEAIRFGGEQIRNATIVYFRRVTSKDDVDVGVLVLEDSSGRLRSLDEVMIDAKLLAVNETLFDEGILWDLV